MIVFLTQGHVGKEEEYSRKIFSETENGKVSYSLKYQKEI